jgi:hypothetical protein
MPEVSQAMAQLPEEVYVQKGNMSMVTRLGFTHILFTTNYAHVQGTF